MKLLHMSDLHIGKRMNGFSMLEDQRYILEQILGIAEQEKADGVILAGDIYDKAVPSAEAVQIFDWFLTQLAARGKKVFVVSGNHDSAERIAFGAQLMQGRDVFVSPVYDREIRKVTCRDDFGELCIYLMPFIKPAVVRHAWREMEEETEPGAMETYQEAVQFVLENMEIDTAKRNILVAHQFVTGAARCESENILVGGLDNVDAELFYAFDYVALGHIHSPQHIGRETVRYCGTPLKYSFSEVEQIKSVTMVNLREKGDVAITPVPLTPLRDLCQYRGTYMELMSKEFYEGLNREDYVEITLTDEEDIPDGMQKLRTRYPNLMRLSYDNSRTRQNGTVEAAEQVEQKSEQELFGEFYEMQNNSPMSAEQKEFVDRLFREIRGE